ncbi:MAG TPA: hypothetical protein VMY37_04545 [Thermoguttaceae bacterium]|nr:hypothetical protein [Thermoguttaceae bacterium]
MGFIAGKYDVVTGTYADGPDITTPGVGAGISIGQTEGINLEFSSIEEDNRGDNLGRSIQDAVYQGGNCFLDLNLLQSDRSHYIAGHHQVKFGTNDAEADIGDTEGVDLEWVMHAEPIVGDSLGESIQDFVYQGADVSLQLTLLSFNAQAYESFKAYWPWAPDHGTLANQVLQLGKLHKAGAGNGPIGRLASSDAVKSLILTPDAGSPAAGNVFDFHYVKLANGYPVRLLMAPSLRRVPIRFQVYPDATRWFTFTAGAGPTLADVAWPWSATWGNVGTIGVLLSSLAKGIKLTPLASTPADVATGPKKIVAGLAVLAPEFPIRLSLTPTLRRLRIRLQLLPYATAGDANQYVHYEPLMA